MSEVRDQKSEISPEKSVTIVNEEPMPALPTDTATAERAAVNEKKIQRVMEWLNGNDKITTIRYKRLVLIAQMTGKGNVPEETNQYIVANVQRDADIVQWFNKAHDEMLRTAASFDDAMRSVWPKSRHEVED